MKLLMWVKIGEVKSSQNGEIAPNLVTLVTFLALAPSVVQ
jgi:hypothetical protein